jgi:asparagine synthase (glutamine-hydrolysing)
MAERDETGLRRLSDQFVRLVYTARLSPLARAVRRQRLTYLRSEPLFRLERELHRLLQNNVPGDFLEFGVALGGSAIVIASRLSAGRSFHGFDAFGMIPSPDCEKDGTRAKERYAVIAAGKSKGIRGETYYGYRDDLYGQVRGSFERHGLTVDGHRIGLHKGLFEDTWRTYDGRQVAFAHIDCDWYNPVRFCLSKVAEQLSSGGAIIVDDYHTFDGCRAATDEFLVQHPEFEIDDGPNVILRKPEG